MDLSNDAKFFIVYSPGKTEYRAVTTRENQFGEYTAIILSSYNNTDFHHYITHGMSLSGLLNSFKAREISWLGVEESFRHEFIRLWRYTR